jgi:hypothetical protein
MSTDSNERDTVLRRLLKTPPTPHKPAKRSRPKINLDADQMPADDAEALVERGKRNIQK